MHSTSTPFSHRLPAAKVCTLPRLDSSTTRFDGSLAPYIPNRTCLCEGPRQAPNQPTGVVTPNPGSVV